MSLRRGRWFAFFLTLLTAFVATSVFSADAKLPFEKAWPIERYWLPEQASSYAPEIDGLFVIILWLTGIVFVGTQLALVLFLLVYRHREGRKAHYTHGNHAAELAWTITPAVLLGAIALVQSFTWNHIKRDVPDGVDVEKIQLLAQQFSWNFRYPGTDGLWGTDDDITTNNELVVPVRRNIVIEQTSKDVIHSFFLPYQRLKQDVVPGLQTKVWFKPTKTTALMRETRPAFKDEKTGQLVNWDFEIVCAELCGIGHGNMRGKLTVLSQKEYDAWVARESARWADRIKKGKERDAVWKMWPVNEKGERLWFDEDVKAQRAKLEKRAAEEAAKRKAEEGEEE